MTKSYTLQYNSNYVYWNQKDQTTHLHLCEDRIKKETICQVLLQGPEERIGLQPWRLTILQCFEP